MVRRQKLEAMLEKTPEDIFLNFGLAMELVKEGATDRALAQLDRVLELDPRYTAAHYQKGSTLIALGRNDEARAVLTAGVNAAKETGDAHTERELLELMATLPQTPPA